MILAPTIKDAAVGLMVVNRDRGPFDGLIAAKAPLFGAQQREVLRDIAVITGGRCIVQDAHDRLEDVTIADFGRARQVWVTHSDFGIIGGQGSKAALRDRIGEA